MISFRFRLSEDEYYRFNYFTAWADPRRKRYRMLYLLKVIILYAAVAFLYIYATKPRLYGIDISVFFITGLVYLLLIPFFIKKSVRRRVSDILSKKENDHILEESEIVLDASGIIDRDILAESRYSWDAIVHCANTSDAVYLYTNSHHAIVIPKRVVKDAAVENELQLLLKANLPLHAVA